MTANSRFFLVLPLLVLVFGCGKTTNTPAKLSGTVKYNGNPVTGGTIALFSSKEGGLYNIPINPDGTYSSANLPSGELEVTIETESINPKNQRSAAQYGGQRGKDKMGMSPRPQDVEPPSGGGGGVYVNIPAKYNAKDTSGLTVTLTSGDNKKDFDLTP
jgi:hypothetical protein